MIAYNVVGLCIALVLLSSGIFGEESSDENISLPVDHLRRKAPLPPGAGNEGHPYDNSIMNGHERQAVDDEEEMEAKDHAANFNFVNEASLQEQQQEIQEEGEEFYSNATMNDDRRKKRSYLQANTGVWEKCIVPYIWHESLPESHKVGIGAVFAGFEKWTGFRFVPYTGSTSEEYGLSHNNHLIFKSDSNGCRSYIGNSGGINGQRIWACGGGNVAYHEIGHALGLLHEQLTPVSFDHLDVFYKNINPQYWSEYQRHNFENIDGHDRQYDISSIMHYQNWGYNVNYGQTLRAHDPDVEYLIGAENMFYMFKKLQEYHKCYDEFDSCATKPTCHRGGYVSVIEGVCACRCPEGLDPATNCQSAKTIVPVTTWPNGKFTVTKVKDFLCPSCLDTGNIVHWTSDWVWKGSDFMSPGYHGYKVSHDVCTQTVSSGTAVWPEGSYCLLRYDGTCPTGFEEGIIETYGGAQQENSTWTVPDGQHDQLFEYLFCCRNDGNTRTPIALPNAKAFMLWRGKSGCQEVEGMFVVGEYFVFRNNLNHGLNRSLNISGSTPFFYKFGEDLHNQYVCAYFPITTNGCGEVRTFTTETSYTFTSPGYPVAYPQLKECWWHYQSPVGTTMQLDWNGFEIPHDTDTTCSSHVGVKFVDPGMPMFKFCGHNYKKTFTTWKNSLTVKLLTDNTIPWKGFNATITIIKDEDLCYTKGGKDMSYAGKVNYAKSTFNPCLPWNDVKVKKCLFNQFDYRKERRIPYNKGCFNNNSRTTDNDLSENNYCRNVGTGSQPWCYTVGETCYREYCDACRSGACYDLSSECADWLIADLNFCSNNKNGEAHRLCMDTCGQCAKHVKLPAVKDITCPLPCDVKGISANLQAPSYRVGDFVTYTCPADGVVRTRTCKSDGKWTNLNFVCGACSTGWTYLGVVGRCFKWLGWEVNVDYEDAKSMCTALGNAVPIKVESKFMVDFLTDFVEYDKNVQNYVWIGLTADTNRKWNWEDGTSLNESFTYWHDNRPDDWGSNEDCVISKGNSGRWEDVRCDSALYDVVCEKTPGVNGDCEDQLDNCVSILTSEPELCIKQYDYAWANCRKTCDLCAVPTVTCTDDANLLYRGSRIQGEDTVAIGKVVEYECAAGYHHTNGTLLRACLNTGQLTGSTPICSIGDITCPLPCDVKGISANPQAPSYRVGDFVTYTCPIDGVVRTRTCKGDGKWTTLSFVCGACPTGWTYLGVVRRCFKWLGWEVNVDYEDAKSMCTALGNAVPIKVESKFMVDFLMDFVEYDKNVHNYVWIGLTADTNRKWNWEDGTSLNESFTYWHDIYGDCEDQLDNCVSILTSEPELCIKQYDYAWANCRKTCDLCAVPTVTCTDDANLLYRGSRIQGEDTVAIGKVVEYECAAGYHHTSGTLLRTCLNTGQLTGSTPICSIPEETDNVVLFPEVEIFRRRDHTNDHQCVIAPGVKDMTFNTEGMVSSWSFYSNQPGVIALQVWRPNIDSNTTNQYMLVGQNILNTLDNRRMIVTITDPSAQIHAKVGDLVGIYQTTGQITFTRCEDIYEPEYDGYLSTTSTTSDPSTLALNTDHGFVADSTDCRTYSIRVTLDPSAVLRV